VSEVFSDLHAAIFCGTMLCSKKVHSFWPRRVLLTFRGFLFLSDLPVDLPVTRGLTTRNGLHSAQLTSLRIKQSEHIAASVTALLKDFQIASQRGL